MLWLADSLRWRKPLQRDSTAAAFFFFQWYLWSMFFITDIFGVQRAKIQQHFIYFFGLSLTLGKVTQISKGTPVKWDNKACKMYSTEKATYQFYCVFNFLSSSVIRHWCISDSYDKKGVCHSFYSKESFWNDSLFSNTICMAVVSTIQVFCCF